MRKISKIYCIRVLSLNIVGKLKAIVDPGSQPGFILVQNGSLCCVYIGLFGFHSTPQNLKWNSPCLHPIGKREYFDRWILKFVKDQSSRRVF